MLSLKTLHVKMKLMYFPLCILYVHVLFVCFCHCWSGSETAEVLRPRGVSLSKKVFYVPSKDFSCIDGSSTIPFSFVNDDYCDCEDGSDEPGTSACPNAVFHCVNAGHISENIPSSRVNDNICDCCDGGDEYNSSADCVNICIELGRQAREAAQQQQELYERGHALWQQYATQGKQIKENNKVKLETLKQSEQEEEKTKAEKEAIKNEIEEKEKAALEVYKALKEEQLKEQEAMDVERRLKEERMSAESAFKELDLNGDQVLTIEELQQFKNFDSDQDGQVSEDEAKFFLLMKDTMEIEEFASRGWIFIKPVYLQEKTPSADSPIEKPAIDSYETETSHEQEESDDETYSPEDDNPTDEDSELLDDDEDQEPPVFPPKEDVEQAKADELEYDEETQNIVNAANQARNEYKESVDRLDKIRDEIKQIESDIEGDFGPEEEFAVLKGQCFDFEDREYTYRLCPFDKASQIAKSGGSDVNLGRWGVWFGPENAKYSKMQFQNGQTCWNGPARTATVVLQCGLENKVFSTSEPNRCEYLFEFSTPALCSFSHNKENVHVHTEL